ncbi:MAG: hypothetical protein ACHQ51_09910 [Elusimicrobiota bacterium]
MKIFKRLTWLALLASVAYSGRELLSVVKMAKGLAANPGAAAKGAPSPAARAFAPRPEHAEAGDTNSSPGKIFAAKGGSNKASRPGGAVIVDASGNRLELVPAPRPKVAVAAEAIKTFSKAELPKLELPTLDDPRAGLQARKLRAEGALAACALAALVLAFWARKYRIG